MSQPARYLRSFRHTTAKGSGTRLGAKPGRAGREARITVPSAPRGLRTAHVAARQDDPHSHSVIVAGHIVMVSGTS
ncbi:hypothetical protein ACFWD7_41625 [Streptomyces mirabilis]|uniref:hypothetical protein n=1 Tax=Streptomyces mirabilis TaxID=68239 RepID=UPI003689275C